MAELYTRYLHTFDPLKPAHLLYPARVEHGLGQLLLVDPGHNLVDRPLVLLTFLKLIYDDLKIVDELGNLVRLNTKRIGRETLKVVRGNHRTHHHDIHIPDTLVDTQTIRIKLAIDRPLGHGELGVRIQNELFDILDRRKVPPSIAPGAVITREGELVHCGARQFLGDYLGTLADRGLDNTRFFRGGLALFDRRGLLRGDFMSFRFSAIFNLRFLRIFSRGRM